MNTQNQRGAVLLVSLIMLVVITVIGLASMRDTSLQEKMAANLRDQDAALQAAEAALRGGERRLLELFRTSAGLAQIEASKNNAAAISGNTTALATAIAAPRYQIQFLGHARINNPVAGEPVDEGYLVRVRGEGTGLLRNNQGNNANNASSRTAINTLVLVVPDQLDDN